MFCFEILSQENDNNGATKLIGHFNDIEERVSAYLSAGKLRSAYLEAANAKRDDQVLRVRNTAAQASGTNPKNIVELCDKYLKKPK